LFSRLDNIASCIDTWRLAKLTEGFSGSDLRELCRHAAVCRVYELAPEDSTLRPITMDDLLASLAKMKESKIECGELDLRTPNLD
jgi:SpoVK/Ycf46/Vps4 family AAA+-type ATPase